MNYGSICSGVEAASLAWEPLGWTAKFFAEVEPFPSAVLQQKFGALKPLRPLLPETAEGEKERRERESWAKQIAELPEGGAVPNLGDFTQITTEDYDGTIDLLVGGTPCQSYSIAGLRKGLADPRGNLALEFVKLAYRTGVRWTLWENVPGVLSSGGGKDFASFLSLLCGWEVEVPKDGWRKCGIVTPAPGCFGLAWRILDAQYTRVSKFPRAIPQRRRRIFVVGYLGSWEYPAQVLFDGEMRGGDSPPCRTKGQTASSDIEGGIASADTIRMRCGKPDGGGKGALVSHELSLTIATANDQTLVTLPESAKWWDGGDKANTLTVTSNQQLMPDKGRLQCVIEPAKNSVACFDIRQIEILEKGISPTLIATDYKGGKAVMADKEPLCFENNLTDARLKEVPVAPTVLSRWGTGGNNTPLVINGKKNVCPTLEANLFNKNTFQDCEKFVVEANGEEPVAFIKNDAGGEQQGYWNGVFPTVRSQVIPAIAYNVTFCDANGTRKDRPDGGLYVTEAEASKTVTTGGTNAETVIIEKERNLGVDPYNMAVTGDVSSTLGVNCGTSTGRNGVCENVIALDGDKMAKGERKGGAGLGVSTEGVMYTQTVKDVHAVAYGEKTDELTVIDMMAGKPGCHVSSEEVSPTLATSHGESHAIAYQTAEECIPLDLRNATRDPEKYDEMNRQGVGVGKNGEPMNTVTANAVPGVGYQATVRRLLPVECERLMGFPDGHTLIQWKGKPETECPDAPRYKACGNSMCVNVMAWIGERIDKVEKEISSCKTTNNGGGDERK